MAQGSRGNRALGRWGHRVLGDVLSPPKPHFPTTPKPYHPITLIPDYDHNLERIVARRRAVDVDRRVAVQHILANQDQALVARDAQVGALADRLASKLHLR